MNSSDWIAAIGLAVTVVTAAVTGTWAFVRFRRSSPYSSERAKHYEEAFREICIGTIPRMSSYDWKTSVERFDSDDERVPIYRDLISKSENLDSRYWGMGATPELDASWIRKRVLEGEEVLNKNRLYIDQEDRDVFRDYLVTANAYADSGLKDDQVLDRLFKLRDKLSILTAKKMKVASR